MTFTKKINVFLIFSTLTFTFFAVNNTYGAEKSEVQWSEKGNLLKEIRDTEWDFKIDNKRADTVLLEVIEDKDINTEKAPVVELEARGRESQTVSGKKINLPAIYKIQVTKGDCKWDFSPKSLLMLEPPGSLFINTHPNHSKCGQASGVISIEFENPTKTTKGKGNFLFTLETAAEVSKPLP